MKEGKKYITILTDEYRYPSEDVSIRCRRMERSLSDVPPLILQAAKPLIRRPKTARTSIAPARGGSVGVMRRSMDSLMTKTEPTKRIVEMRREPRSEKRL